MANAQLINYIRYNLQRGIGLEEIKKNLRSSGWPENEINQAMQEVSKMDNPQLPKMKKSRKKLIIIPLILIEKVREIYQYQESVVSSKYPYIQIHLDKVKNLGTFLELEMESSEDTFEKDKKLLQNLANELGIKKEHLEKLSYSDLLSIN